MSVSACLYFLMKIRLLSLHKKNNLFPASLETRINSLMFPNRQKLVSCHFFFVQFVVSSKYYNYRYLRCEFKHFQFWEKRVGRTLGNGRNQRSHQSNRLIEVFAIGQIKKWGSYREMSVLGISEIVNKQITFIEKLNDIDTVTKRKQICYYFLLQINTKSCSDIFRKSFSYVLRLMKQIIYIYNNLNLNKDIQRWLLKGD